MTETIHLQLLLATFAGWVGRRQARVIAYLIEENCVLKEQLELGDINRILGRYANTPVSQPNLTL